MGIAILPTSMLELSDKLKACEVCDADFTTEVLLAWREKSDFVGNTGISGILELRNVFVECMNLEKILRAALQAD